MNEIKRIPKNYRGKLPTGRSLKQLLPKALMGIQQKQKMRPDLILAAWEEVVGAQIASMSKAVRFSENMLFVKVRNSSLLHVLDQYEKKRLIQEMRRRFPDAQLKTIIFRIG